MSWDVVSDVLQMVQRIESALIYTLVRFLYSLIGDSFSPSVVIYLTSVLALVFYGLRRVSGLFDGGLNAVQCVLYISRLFQKFSTLILTQAIIRSVQPPSLEGSSILLQVECLASSLCLLVLLAPLPRWLTESEDGQQFMRLVLYMFTSNTEFVVQQVHFGWTLPLLSAAGFVALNHIRRRTGSGDAVAVLVSRALTLSLTNMMILTSWTVELTSTDRASQLTQMVSLLVLFDAISRVYSEFGAMRDYAVWQGAAQIYGMLEMDGVGGSIVVVTSLFGIMGLHVASSVFASSAAVTELLVLLVINEVLGQVKAMIHSIHSNDTVIIVTMWLIIIETGLAVVKHLAR